MQNKTSVSNAALYAESQLLPEFRISMDGTPQVLIMHTHTQRPLSHLNGMPTMQSFITGQRTAQRTWLWSAMPLQHSWRRWGSV